MDGLQQRRAFVRQPARAVLFDFRPPMDAGTCLNMLQALTDTLMLAYHLSGPSRVPLFSLIVLGLYPEALYPLQPVTGNQARLLGALRELKNMCTASTLPASSTSCLSEGIDEALMQLRRQQTLNNGSNAAGQLEITIVTSVSSSVVHRQLSSLSNCPTLEYVKRIQVLCVHDGMSGQDDEMRLIDDDNQSELLASLLDVLPIENDILSFQSVFNCWLHDCNMDTEHLSLSLPLGSDADAGSTGVTLKCDLYERILDPALLSSCADHFLLTAPMDRSCDAQCGNKQSLLATQQNMMTRLHHLTAVGLVASGGVCESVLYGMPLIMMPTACWRLDWEELEENRDHFYALCQLLKEKDMLLLARELTTSPTGHYLILPSPTHSLLIKPIAISELLLPIEMSHHVETPSDSAIHSVQECVGKLELMETYNPLLVSSHLSGLLSTIPSNKRTTSGSMRGGAKRKYQPPLLVQPHTQQPPAATRGRKLTTSSVKRPKAVNFATGNEPHLHGAPRKGYAPLDSALH